tara:strand:+ start:13267 stop:14811 length:1545 start_codon:yes stop_codon:yes gene_type:complete
LFLHYDNGRREKENSTMANLKSLREKVKNITDYSPELAQFNDQMDELLNDAYYDLWTRKRWRFSTKLGFLRFHVDMFGTRDNENAGAGGVVTAAVTASSRLVTFSAAMDRLPQVDVWEGQPISIQDQEYTISRIETSTTLIIDRDFEGTTNAADTTWVIKKRTYDLPEDTLELLYLGHRDYPYNTTTGTQNPFGKSTGLFPRREEEINLRVDLKRSYAECYIPQPVYFTQPAETLTTATVAGGNFALNNYYELCWAFIKDGKISALSEPKTHKIAEGATGIRVTFKSWDGNDIDSDTFQTEDTSTQPWEGYRKTLFWNKNIDRATGERLGLPCWLAVINGGGVRNLESYIQPAVVADTVAFYDILNTNQLDNGAKRYIERDGQHQQIRPYPRVDGFDFTQPRVVVGGVLKQPKDYIREGVIRYMKKPNDMLLDTDSPEMPVEFHQLIAYHALENIYLKLGQQGLAANYEKKYLTEIKNLERRYVDKIDFQAQRGQFSFGNSMGSLDGTTLRRLN